MCRLIRLICSNFQNFVHSFGLLSNLKFDLAKWQKRYKAVSFSKEIVLPFLFHEDSTLFSKILMAKHVTNPKIVNPLTSVLLYLRQLIGLADPELSI